MKYLRVYEDGSCNQTNAEPTKEELAQLENAEMMVFKVENGRYMIAEAPDDDEAEPSWSQVGLT